MSKVVSILGLALLLGLAACSRQQSDWEKTRAANTADAYEQFLKKYPGGEFAAQAQARVKELNEERDWQKARDLDSADAYEAFVKQYPEGRWSDEARIRLENFTLAAVPSNAAPANPATSPPADAAPPAASAAPPTQTPAAPPTRQKTQKPPSKAASATGAGKPSAAGPGPSAGKYAVQLGAFKSGEDAANKHWSNLSGNYPKLLGGLQPRISPREVATGTLYRLQVANLSFRRARAICKGLKAHAETCQVLRPGQQH